MFSCFRFYYIIPLGFLPWETGVAFPGKTQLRQSRATHSTCMLGVLVSLEITELWHGTTGCLTWICDLFACVYTRDLGLWSQPNTWLSIRNDLFEKSDGHTIQTELTANHNDKRNVQLFLSCTGKTRLLGVYPQTPWCNPLWLTGGLKAPTN